MIEIKNKKTDQIYGAMFFGPSQSGKSNFATLVPPKELQDEWEIKTVSDDIVGLWIHEEGYPVGANLENGFFAVAPGTNEETNKVLIDALKGPKPVVFTNVAYNTITGEVWWEEKEKEKKVPIPPHEWEQYERWFNGETDNPPKSLEGWLDWRGDPIKDWPSEKRKDPEKREDLRWAHPNARFTINQENLESRSKDWFEGRRIDLIFFGGRLKKYPQPPLTQLTTYKHGILDGFFMAPEGTVAAEELRPGERRPDPFALRPFYGITERQHLDTWLYVMKQLEQNGTLPGFFHFNQFRDGWPGFSENARLVWLALAMKGELLGKQIDGVDTILGKIPTPQAAAPFLGEIITPEVIAEMFSYDPEYGKKEAERWIKFLDDLEAKGFRLPDELLAIFQELVRQATGP